MKKINFSRSDVRHQLQRARKKLGWSQQKLAEETNLTHHYIQGLEAEKRNLNDLTRDKLEMALNISLHTEIEEAYLLKDLVSLLFKDYSIEALLSSIKDAVGDERFYQTIPKLFMENSYEANLYEFTEEEREKKIESLFAFVEEIVGDDRYRALIQNQYKLIISKSGE